MAPMKRRTWTDPRDDREWTIVYEPPVELDNRRVRRFRERLVLSSDDETLTAPAVFGADLEALAEADLQGLVDQARRSAE